MSTFEQKVPDLGDFEDVPVIEVLIKPGDSVEAEQPLLVLESDKATMEVPASQAGKVKAVKAKVGDKVSKGDVIAILETSEEKSKDEKPEKPPQEPKPEEEKKDT